MDNLANTDRRHDIDWLRTIAIFLLMLYHTTIVFQPWANEVWFIRSEQSLETLWLLMEALNIWRIPLLFLVSGMGVAFAMRRRTWLQLVGERVMRIVLPLIFGMFLVVPIHLMLFQSYQSMPLEYTSHAAHLWFLNNLVIYLSLFVALFYWLDTRRGHWPQWLGKPPIASWLYLSIIPAMLLASWVNPENFAAYASSLHGLVYGGYCFLLGFMFIYVGPSLQLYLQRWRFLHLAVAVTLYLSRLLLWELQAPNWLNALESMFWLFAILGLAGHYLNRPSRVLRYLSAGVYPMYIVHMVALYANCFWLLPLQLNPSLSLLILTLCTLVQSLLFYELIRHIPWLRKLFGIK
ncbi:MAG: acyltransferase family protein [Algicola sp.]|nr:acyltransferase family protein [Algicola sp.]